MAAGFVVSAACADTAARGTGATTGSATDTGTVVCQVTDVAGVDDNGQNQLVAEALTTAEIGLDVERRVFEPNTDDEYEAKVEAAVADGCDLVLGGLLLEEAMVDVARAEPEAKFAGVDLVPDPPLDNVLGITFAVDQSAFLGGYVAAAVSVNDIVGTFGTIDIPEVTTYMNGFAAGMLAYNADTGADVRLLGWDPVAQEGSFSGLLDARGAGTALATEQIEDGADVIMPATGEAAEGAAEAAAATGYVKVVWPGLDGCRQAPQTCEVVLTSVRKRIDQGVLAAVQQVVDGTFSGGVWAGTLANGGVDLTLDALEDQVPEEVLTRVEELRQRIVDGLVSVDPSDYLT